MRARRRAQRRLGTPPPLSPLIPVHRRRRRRPGWPAAIVLAAAGVIALAAWQVPGRIDEPAGAGSTTGAGDGGARALAAAGRGAAPKPRSAKPDPLLVDGRRIARKLRRPLRARGAILVEASTGRVLYARYPHRRLPIASTTKIMTALLALEHVNLARTLTIGPKVARVHPFREGLRAGERVKAWKLLYGLMLYSGNDDALALALATSGTRDGFLRLMNKRARQLELRHTHFTSPSGVIDRGNYSTAWDMAALTRFAMRLPRFRAVVRTRRKRVRWATPTFSKIYVNKNSLLGSYRGADGVKTGWTTKAGHCLVASARRDGRRLIAVVLGAPDAGHEARRLLNLGFRS
jgi:D-alanyl-D-alanine carboxypeptidase